MDFEKVKMNIPAEANIIIGQAHFIKTVEDLYEVMVNSISGGKFAIAFCEASGPCLIRAEGNDKELKKVAIGNASALGAGHIFVILLRDIFPLNVLNDIKNCREVCSVFCATANPVEVVVAETEQGRGVMGIIDGFKPKGIEKEKDIKLRKGFLRKIGYKL